jgi:hypothetical protein
MKNNSPLKAYAVAGQISSMIIVPLLLFIGGGCWLADKLGWAEWTKIICVLLGIVTMFYTVGTYLKKIIKMYDDSKGAEPQKLDKRDYDYYDDNVRFKK